MNYNAQKILTLTMKYFYSYFALPAIFLSLGMLEGTPPSKPGTIIYPIQHNIIAHSPISNIKGQYDTSRIRTILILKPYSTKKRIQLTSEKEKMAFARELYTMIPNDLIIGGIKVRSNTENFEFQFQQRDQIDIERFWISNEMQKIWISIHSRQVVFADVELHGWQTTPFQNTPSARSKLKNLFSLSLLLKPGLNAFQLMFLDSLSSPVFIDSINIFYTIPTLADSPPSGA